MNMKSIVFLAMAALAGAASGATTGSCYASAASLKGSQTVTLTPEYDKEMYEGYDDSGAGVYYLKIKLSRYTDHTIWITGGDAADIELDVDVNWDAYGDTDTFPMATFDVVSYKDGSTKAATITAGDWDEEDPKTVTFYVMLSGDMGQKTTVYYTSGIKSFVLDGEEGKPLSLTMKDAEQTTKSLKLIESEYWFKAKLTAGRLYQVTTSGGTEESKLAVVMDGDCSQFPVPTFTDEFNDSEFLTPEETGTYKFFVSGIDESQSFKLTYKSIPSLAITKHDLVGELSAENEYALAVQPGALHASYDYWDEIIDRSLAKVTLAKGERWVFDTTGATVPCELRVYNSSGTIIASNDTIGNGSFDCRVAITTAAAGTYYVGVFDTTLDVGEDTKAPALTLAARNCDGIAPPDSFDTADDAYAGASLLYAANGSSDADVGAVGSSHGPHKLGASDWYDFFAIPCRNGVTYKLRAEYAEEDVSSTLHLAAEVFYLDDKKKKKVISTTGDLTPSTLSSDGLEFKATQNRTYYIGVSVAEGVGLDYPAYDMRTMAYRADGVAMGLLCVKTKGADATWKLNKETLSYPNGAVVNLPVGAAKVVFSAVTGFATPAAAEVTVVAGASLKDSEVIGVYNDSFDSYTKTINKKKVVVTDDEATGAVTLTAKTATQYAQRTLWTTDPRDMFLFKASAGVYYNFKLVDTTQDGAGDALFCVTDANDAEVVGATDNVSKRLFDAGNHYLTVAHANPGSPVDTSYTLEYSAFNAGTVKFAAAKYTVNETANFATLTLKRTAKEGRIRVNYATVQGASENEAENALPGSEYYPASGVIEWVNGDMKDKTIKVRLIPDLVAKREANKSFTVKIWAMDPDDIEEDEYPAQITLDTTTVTLTEATAANAGTVSVTAFSDDDTPISNVKKPAFSVVAGDDAVMTVSRVGGSNGRIAVKLAASKAKGDTARAGTDFDADSDVFVWEDGETDDKEFRVPTYESTDLTASRKFTVSMSVLTTGAYSGYSKPALSAKTAAVTIKNNDYIKPFKTVQTEAKANGVALSASGTWYVDSDGNFRSTDTKSASVTFQVTGPGVFVALPTAGGCGTISCRVGSGETVNPSGLFACAVPAGKKQKVVFTYKEGDGMSHPAFEPLEAGSEVFYRWVPFTKFAAYEPFSKSVVRAGLATNLVWTVPAELSDIPMYYRVRHGLASNKIVDELGWTSSSSIAIPSDVTDVYATTHYWSLDFAIGPNKYVSDPAELKWTPGGNVWTFSTAADGAVTTDIALVDAYGNDYYDDDGNVALETIRLVQGVAASFEIGPSDSTEETKSTASRVYSGSLPPGLTLDGRAGMGVVSGVPTKAGSYTAVLQTATGTTKKPVWGSTITLRFEVEPIGSGAGTFFGCLTEDGSAVGRAAPSVGMVKLTVAATGKLSATVNLAGNTYAFTGNGFTEILSASDGTGGLVRMLQAELVNSSKYTKISKNAVYKSTMTVMMLDAASVSEDAQESVAYVELDMNVPNGAKTDVTENVAYTAALYRNNSTEAANLSALNAFNGYYTLALVPEGVDEDDGLPLGNGFLGVKVAAKGAVTITGRKADGQTVSASTTAAVIGDPEDPSSCTLRIPFATTTSTACLGGVLELVWGEDDLPYIDSAASSVIWGKDGSGSTEDGSGFLLDVVPSGGWYNTTDNLQRYYLDYDFTLDGVGVTLSSNAITLESNKGDTASAITYSLNRATGIASGTLTSFSEYQNKNVTKCPHYGMLIFTRDAAAPLADNIWTAGFFIRKATKTWNESLPFNILSEEIDRDWSEATLPSDGEE